MSEAAKAKRILRGFADLSGITFVAKIKVEASNNAAYSDKNKLDRVVLPDGARVAADHERRGGAGPPEHAPAAARRPRPRPRRRGARRSRRPRDRPRRRGRRATAGKPAETPKPAAAGGPAWLNG